MYPELKSKAAFSIAASVDKIQLGDSILENLELNVEPREKVVIVDATEAEFEGVCRVNGQALVMVRAGLPPEKMSLEAGAIRWDVPPETLRERPISERGVSHGCLFDGARNLDPSLFCQGLPDNVQAVLTQLLSAIPATPLLSKRNKLLLFYCQAAIAGRTRHLIEALEFVIRHTRNEENRQCVLETLQYLDSAAEETLDTQRYLVLSERIPPATRAMTAIYLPHISYEAALKTISSLISDALCQTNQDSIATKVDIILQALPEIFKLASSEELTVERASIYRLLCTLLDKTGLAADARTSSRLEAWIDTFIALDPKLACQPLLRILAFLGDQLRSRVQPEKTDLATQKNRQLTALILEHLATHGGSESIRILRRLGRFSEDQELRELFRGALRAITVRLPLKSRTAQTLRNHLARF